MIHTELNLSQGLPALVLYGQSTDFFILIHIELNVTLMKEQLVGLLMILQ